MPLKRHKNVLENDENVGDDAEDDAEDDDYEEEKCY